METARLKLQGIYSLLAGVILLVGIPIYQAIILGPDYGKYANEAFSQGNYGPLLLWISGQGSAFVIFRMLELIALLLAIRLPLALWRAMRAYGRTLAHWMVVGGIGGLGVFAAMIALSTVSFANAAADYSRQTPGSAVANNILSSFSGLYGVESLGQNTLGGALIAIFLLCASLLMARSGKLPGLLVYFGLLVAALMAALAVLFAVSPASAQTQLTAPAVLSFAVWLIWLGILLIQRAQRLVPAPASGAAPASEKPRPAASSAETTPQPQGDQEQASDGPLPTPPV